MVERTFEMYDMCRELNNREWGIVSVQMQSMVRP